MVTLALVLLIAAFVVFALAAFNVPITRISPVALGLALWVLSLLVDRIKV